MAKQKFTGTAGLPLPRRAVRVLKDQGIFAHALVSVEHQQLAQRYVVRGLESGGSAVTWATISRSPTNKAGLWNTCTQWRRSE